MRKIKYKNTHALVNIKLIFFFVLILLMNSCEKDDLQKIPSYINISEYNLITNPIVERRTESTSTGMVTGSDAQRLQEDEGDKGTSL